jgi:chorismate mutase
MRKTFILLVTIWLVASLASDAASGAEASAEALLVANRKEIDSIDRQIVSLINRRATIVDNIGEIKSGAGLPVTVPQREQQVLRSVTDFGRSGPLPTARLQNIYSTLLTQMREWEEERHPSKK